MELLVLALLPVLVLVGVLLLILKVSRRWNHGKGKTVIGTVTTASPPTQIRSAVVRAIGGIRKATVQSASDAEVQATVGMTWRSWGEVITVRVDPVGDRTQVQIESRSRFNTTVIDWGKNHANVDQISTAVASLPQP